MQEGNALGAGLKLGAGTMDEPATAGAGSELGTHRQPVRRQQPQPCGTTIQGYTSIVAKRGNIASPRTAAMMRDKAEVAIYRVDSQGTGQ